MKFNEALKQFENYQRNVLGRSENTIKNYKCDLCLFAQMMNLEEVETSKQQAEKFIAKLAEKGASATTRARRITALQMFYKYLYDNDFIGENPMTNLVKPKIPQKKVKVMSDEEVEKLLKVLKNRKYESVTYFRNLTIIWLFCSTGLRRNELVNIRLDDVNLENRSILVREGKGNKQRIVYYNDTVQALLSEYIASHRKLMSKAENSDYLFVSQKSEKIEVSCINRMVNKLYDEAGIDGYVVHSLRKVFATKIYNETHDIIVTQNLLGHSSPQTTMRYVGINEEMKQKAAQLVNF